MQIEGLIPFKSSNSLRISPSELFSTSCHFSSLLLDFFVWISFRLRTVSLISKLEFIYSTFES